MTNPLDTSPIVEMKTYEIDAGPRGGTFRVTFPATWKVTYGPVIGANGKAVGAYGETGMCLRIWETDKLQRGLWTGVVAFRDVSLPMTVAAVRRYGSDEWRFDDGTWTGKKAEQVEKKWLPIEEITTTPDYNTETADEEISSLPRRPRTVKAGSF